MSDKQKSATSFTSRFRFKRIQTWDRLANVYSKSGRKNFVGSEISREEVRKLIARLEKL